MPDITVYGASVSPFVRKVVVIAQEKGICTDVQPMTPNAIPEDIRAHSPLGKIPFANIKGNWLADSSIISRYLEDLWPTPSFYPADAYDKARAMWFEEYIDGGLIPRVGPKTIYQRLVRPVLLGEAGDEALVQHALANDLPPMLAYLEEAIGGREFFVGDSISIADVTVASVQVTMHHADIHADASLYPNLVRHRDAMWARPSFAALIEAETAFLAGLKEQAGVATS